MVKAGQECKMTRSVRDTALMLDQCSGGDIGAPYSAPLSRQALDGELACCLKYRFHGKMNASRRSITAERQSHVSTWSSSQR